MSPIAVAQVDALLAQIRAEHGVHIPLAIESGSRAWGFPSPDSDYDCRFIYVRPASHALTIWPRRDVIETPLVGDMDVNGWDLSKALRLLLKGNAVVVEWLNSPIIYEGQPWFRSAMLAFAESWLDRGRVASHYLHLGRKQMEIHLEESGAVPLKKLFYALRPAAALRWLRLHPDKAAPPMQLQALVGESDFPAEVRRLIFDLIERKARTREMGEDKAPAALLAFIRQELGYGELIAGGTPPISKEAMEAADAAYGAITLRLDRP